MTKILIVEDNELNLELIQDILERNEYQWVSAKSGNEAAAAATENEIDLILMDLQLPDMDGFQILDKIRESLGVQTPPTVAVTGNAMEADKRRCLDSGFTGFLRKPFRIHNLLQVIEENLVN